MIPAYGELYQSNSPLISSSYRITVYVQEIYPYMDDNHHLQNKVRRAKRRNFVAKNNKHKAKRHATLKDYNRKPKYLTQYTDV